MKLILFTLLLSSLIGCNDDNSSSTDSISVNLPDGLSNINCNSDDCSTTQILVTEEFDDSTLLLQEISSVVSSDNSNTTIDISQDYTVFSILNSLNKWTFTIFNEQNQCKVQVLKYKVEANESLKQISTKNYEIASGISNISGGCLNYFRVVIIGYLSQFDLSDDDDDDDNITINPGEGELVASQYFTRIGNGKNWHLTNFDFDNSKKHNYISNGEILFDSFWTKRSMKMMAQELGISLEEFKKTGLASCPAKIEVGKASVYNVGLATNYISELDTDLRHCSLISGNYANVRIKSFIPTQVGYQYKLKFKYVMRKYSSLQDKDYRSLVTKFGTQSKKFDPVFDNFIEKEIDLVALNKFSTLRFADNGLPNSLGILIDDIEIYKYNKVPHYDQCLEVFPEGSQGFRNCIAKIVDSSQSCSGNDLVAKFRAGSSHENVPTHRRVITNLFDPSGTQVGHTNFLSLGIGGRVNISCHLDSENGLKKFKALYDIHNKTVKLHEVTWSDKTNDNFPSSARVYARLTRCSNDDLNKKLYLGQVLTNEDFEYKFDSAYQGCKLIEFIIKDFTPENSPDKDGVDLNGLSIN